MNAAGDSAGGALLATSFLLERSLVLIASLGLVLGAASAVLIRPLLAASERHQSGSADANPQAVSRPKSVEMARKPGNARKDAQNNGIKKGSAGSERLIDVASKSVPGTKTKPAELEDGASKLLRDDVSATHADSTCAPSDSLECWEVPLSPRAGDGGLTETEKALMKVVKKLREVKAIRIKIQAGEPIDVKQTEKADRYEQLVEEWLTLREDVTWERNNGGCSRSFVTVRAGVAPSKLRAEAAELAGETSGVAALATEGGPAGSCRTDIVRGIVPSSLLAESAWGGSEPAPSSSSNSRRRRKGKGNADKDDGGGWTVVANPKEKKKAVSEEEKYARAEAHMLRQSLRVVSEDSEIYRLTSESLKNIPLFTPAECEKFEELIEKVASDAERGLFKPHSVDLTPFRNKYFFGHAYTYGAQRDYPGARGVEAVWPPEDVSEIPGWIRELVISKLEAKRVVPKGWLNSATINDYSPGGFIVSHIDPQHLFDRPIISISFFSDCNLVFGAKFGNPDAGPGDATVPLLVHRCQRGCATVMKGYSADKITHGIRSCDLPSRRASIILRRVLPSSPVLADGRVIPLEEHLKQRSRKA